MKEVISVIASGWSLAGIDLARIPGYRIGVNDSAWRTPVDIGVTMDRLYFEGRQQELAQAFGQALEPRNFYYRNGIDKKGNALGHWIRFDCDNESVEMSKDWAPRCRLNGLNSGICGMNLAYRLSPERVILWGFDMCRGPKGQGYYHDPYPWAPTPATKPGRYLEWMGAFAKLNRQFKTAGIELINASPESAITSIRKVDPRSLLL